jgi:uncharacterized membrane protein
MKNRIRSIKIVSFVAGLAILAPTVAAAEEGYSCPGMMFSGFGTPGMMMPFFGLIWLAIAAFIVAVIFWLTYKFIVRPEEKSKIKRKSRRK